MRLNQFSIDGVSLFMILRQRIAICMLFAIGMCKYWALSSLDNKNKSKSIDKIELEFPAYSSNMQSQFQAYHVVVC